MNKFALITEGVTDQVVIKHILATYFDDIDITVHSLEPPPLSTQPVGWSGVIRHCQSAKFKDAFQFNQYIIIQLDTDCAEDYGVSKRVNGQERTTEELIEAVIDELGKKIPDFEIYRNRIIFAIAVHELECWLLPLYYDDKRKASTVGCLGKLNQQLKTKGFTIDPNAKNLHKYYDGIAKLYWKRRKEFATLYVANPSLKQFIDSLPLDDTIRA
jgi:hypothetical protein